MAAMEAHLALSMQEFESAFKDLAITLPFRGRDFIPLKETRHDAVCSALRAITKAGGTAADQKTDWRVLTVKYKQEDALQMYHKEILSRDTACVAPGWRLKEAIDLSSVSHQWDQSSSPALSLEQFIEVHLSDCKVSEAAEECFTCKKVDVVFRRRNSYPYCAACWKVYWGKK